jgi:hypothetical protein
MNLNISKTRALTFSRKPNTLLLKYTFGDSYITRTDCIKDLGVFNDSKLYFHSHVDYILPNLLSFWVSSVILPFHFRLMIVY